MFAGAFGRLRIDLLEVGDHRFDGRLQTVEVETVETHAAAALARLVEVAQPTDEVQDVGVPPHPGRKATKSGERVGSVGILAGPGYVAVDAQRIGPVALDGDRGESLLLDQPLGDLDTFAVELVRPMGCFADHDDTRVADALDDRSVGIFRMRECVGRGSVAQRRDGDGRGRHEARRSDAWFSKARTSSSVTCEKSSYHAPTPPNGCGVS